MTKKDKSDKKVKKRNKKSIWVKKRNVWKKWKNFWEKNEQLFVGWLYLLDDYIEKYNLKKLKK